MRVELLLHVVDLSVAPSRLDVLREISQGAHGMNRTPTYTAVDQQLRLKLDRRELPPQNLAQALLMAASGTRMRWCLPVRLGNLLVDHVLSLVDPLLRQLWLLTARTHNF